MQGKLMHSRCRQGDAFSFSHRLGALPPAGPAGDQGPHHDRAGRGMQLAVSVRPEPHLLRGKQLQSNPRARRRPADFAWQA